MTEAKTLKLNYKRTALIGFAFFGILLLWQVYDSWCPTFLTDIFARRMYDMSSAQLKSSDPDKILNRIVAWCSKYPNKSITISGYADKGTGNPKINVGYAKARAEKVANALYNKGVARERMIVNSYGDTVQPFEENDKNRCVIVVGE